MVRIDFWRTPWEHGFSRFQSRFKYSDKGSSSPDFESPRERPAPKASSDDVTASDVSDADLERALQASVELHEAVEKAKALARQRMAEVAADSYSLSLKRVQADGNCLFRAIAFGLHRREEKHAQIRAAIIDQLKACPERYMHFVNEPFEEYVERMSRDGQYGDHVVLQAACDVLRAEIRILSDAFPNPKADVITIRPTEIVEDSDDEETASLKPTEVDMDEDARPEVWENDSTSLHEARADLLGAINIVFYPGLEHYDGAMPYVSL